MKISYLLLVFLLLNSILSASGLNKNNLSIDSIPFYELLPEGSLGSFSMEEIRDMLNSEKSIIAEDKVLLYNSKLSRYFTISRIIDHPEIGEIIYMSRHKNYLVITGLKGSLLFDNYTLIKRIENYQLKAIIWSDDEFVSISKYINSELNYSNEISYSHFLKLRMVDDELTITELLDKHLNLIEGNDYAFYFNHKYYEDEESSNYHEVYKLDISENYDTLITDYPILNINWSNDSILILSNDRIEIYDGNFDSINQIVFDTTFYSLGTSAYKFPHLYCLLEDNENTLVKYNILNSTYSLQKIQLPFGIGGENYTTIEIDVDNMNFLSKSSFLISKPIYDNNLENMEFIPIDNANFHKAFKLVDDSDFIWFTGRANCLYKYCKSTKFISIITNLIYDFQNNKNVIHLTVDDKYVYATFDYKAFDGYKIDKNTFEATIIDLGDFKNKLSSKNDLPNEFLLKENLFFSYILINDLPVSGLGFSYGNRFYRGEKYNMTTFNFLQKRDFSYPISLYNKTTTKIEVKTIGQCRNTEPGFSTRFRSSSSSLLIATDEKNIFVVGTGNGSQNLIIYDHHNDKCEFVNSLDLISKDHSDISNSGDFIFIGSFRTGNFYSINTNTLNIMSHDARKPHSNLPLKGSMYKSGFYYLNFWYEGIRIYDSELKLVGKLGSHGTKIISTFKNSFLNIDGKWYSKNIM